MTGRFMLDREPIGWSPPAGFPLTLKPVGVFAQNAPNGLEGTV